MRRLILQVGCLSLLLLGGAAFSAEGQAGLREIKLEPSQGITQALKTSGCSIDWLSYVMRQKGIKASRLRHLPVGTRFSVPQDCQNEPSKEIGSSSKRIMERDSRRLASKTAPKKPLQARQNDVLLQKDTEINVLHQALTDLRKENAGLKADKSALEAKLAAGQPSKFRDSLKFMVIAVLASFMAIALVTLVFYLILKKKNKLQPAGLYFGDVVTLKRVIEVEHNGEQVEFRLASYEPADDRPLSFTAYYECPLCKNGRIKEHNLNRHLNSQHPVRIEVVEKKFTA